MSPAVQFFPSASGAEVIDSFDDVCAGKVVCARGSAFAGHCVLSLIFFLVMMMMLMD